MSCTEMYVVEPNGDVVGYDEFRNSHRGSAWIWSEECRAAGLAPHAWLMAGLDGGEGEGHGVRVWEDDYLASIDPLRRAAMISTFDNLIVEPEWMDYVADALEAFEPGTENIKGQAVAMRKAKAEGKRGVCWNQTSVNGSPWWYCGAADNEEEKCGSCDGEGEERPTNVDKDERNRNGTIVWFGQLWIGDDPR